MGKKRPKTSKAGLR